MSTAAMMSRASRRNTAKLYSVSKWRDFVWHGQWRISPSALSTRMTRFNELAEWFDGIAVEFPTGITGWMKPDGDMNISALQAEVNQWNGLNTSAMTQNWAFNLYWYDPPALLAWNDSQWTQVYENAAAYANVMKTANNIQGIMFDSEFYSGNSPYWGQWPEGAPGGQGLQASIDKLRERGNAFMDALKSTWPEVAVLEFFGPGHSYKGTPVFLGVNDVVDHNDLHGAFPAGIQESCQDAGSRCVFIDGGEWYLQRNAQDPMKISWFNEVAVPRRLPINGGNQGTVDIIDPAKAAGYRTPSTCMVYDKDVNNSFAEATPTQLRDWTYWTMRASRSTVVFYSECHDFWEGLHTWAPAGRDEPTQDILDALAEGRRLGRL